MTDLGIDKRCNEIMENYTLWIEMLEDELAARKLDEDRIRKIIQEEVTSAIGNININGTQPDESQVPNMRQIIQEELGKGQQATASKETSTIADLSDKEVVDSVLNELQEQDL